MTIWLDNHLSPNLALWVGDTFGEPCVQVRDLGMAMSKGEPLVEIGVAWS